MGLPEGTLQPLISPVCDHKVLPSDFSTTDGCEAIHSFTRYKMSGNECGKSDERFSGSFQSIDALNFVYTIFELHHTSKQFCSTAPVAGTKG